VDAGRVKRKVYDIRSGTSEFQIGWVSQASADQRAGRAGRTGPGHCYRLYSSAVFGAQFEKFEAPEIEKMPIESAVLNMKTLGIDCVASFPFPSPPKADALLAAIRRLRNIGALDVHLSAEEANLTPISSLRAIQAEKLTPLGRQISRLPLHPTLAKMLVVAVQQQALRGETDSAATTLLEYAVALVACLAVQAPMIRPPPSRPVSSLKSTAAAPGEDTKSPDDTDEDDLSVLEDRDEMDAELLAQFDGSTNQVAVGVAAPLADVRNVAAAAQATFRHPLSDALTVLRIVGAYSHILETAGSSGVSKFCKQYFMRAKSLQEIHKLRKQLHQQLHSTLLTELQQHKTHNIEVITESGPDAIEDSAQLAAPTLSFRTSLTPPSVESEGTLRQILAAGLIENVARRAPPDILVELLESGKVKKGWVPYISPSSSIEGILYVHPQSAAFDSDYALMPSTIVFNEIVVGKYAYMRGCTVIEADWLPALASGTPLCRNGPPLDTPAPFYDRLRDEVMVTVVPHFGDANWKLAPTAVPCLASTFADLEIRVRVFARALLEGDVTPGLLPFTKHWTASPALITKKAHQKRILLLLDVLMHPPRDCATIGPIHSAKLLARVWKAYPSLLRTEIKAWLAVEHHAVLDKVWASIVDHFVKQHIDK
jgi:ATP-dependent RNA helicase DHX37/DHR1